MRTRPAVSVDTLKAIAAAFNAHSIHLSTEPSEEVAAPHTGGRRVCHAVAFS